MYISGILQISSVSNIENVVNVYRKYCKYKILKILQMLNIENIVKFSTCNNPAADLCQPNFSLVETTAWNDSPHFANLKKRTFHIHIVEIKFDHICDPGTDQDHGHGNCNDVTSGHDQKKSLF